MRGGRRLVAVVVGLEGTILGNVEILGLLGREDGQLDVELLKVGTGDLLVQILGQDMDAERELFGSGPEGNLSQYLIGKGT